MQLNYFLTLQASRLHFTVLRRHGAFYRPEAVGILHPTSLSAFFLTGLPGCMATSNQLKPEQQEANIPSMGLSSGRPCTWTVASATPGCLACWPTLHILDPSVSVTVSANSL